MEDKEVKTERIPVGLVTMLLQGYEKTITRLTVIAVMVVAGWLITIGGFLYYLSQYEVDVVNFGDVQESQIDNKRQAADTINNNNLR